MTTVRRTLIFSRHNPLANVENPTPKDFAKQNCYAYVDGQLDVHVATSKELRQKYHMTGKLKIKDNLDSVLSALHGGNGYSFFDEYQRVMTNAEFLHVVLPDRAQIVLAYVEKNSRTSAATALIWRIIQCFRDNAW